jgi:S-formylglutathione hydrolase FrmB
MRRMRLRWTCALAGVAAWLMVAGGAPVATADKPPVAPRGHILRLRMRAPSIGDTSRSVRVYLPASYDTPAAASRRYPVVYLLHGWPGGDGNWPGEGRADDTLDSLIASGRIPETIAVMPNGNGVGLLGRSLYINTADGRSRMEDFIARDLVDWVDRTFRTRADSASRAVVGLSDGGMAAFNLAFRHPDRFGACGSHSAAFRLTVSFETSRLLGTGAEGARTASTYSPLDYVDTVANRIRHLTIYLDCGLDDPDLGSTRALHARLDSLGIAHEYHEDGGGHGWGYWRSRLPYSLRATLGAMR